MSQPTSVDSRKDHVDHVLSLDAVPLPGAIMANYNQTAIPLIVYHIIYADGRVFHIDLNNKAKGQDCLDKICKVLGITDESEYFGLRFHGTKNEFVWVNLRNRLLRQLPQHQPPYSLYFRVKYYVPPHMLQLEETRHQFYLNVVEQLKEGAWCQDITAEIHGQLIALMAQAEFGEFQLATTPCKYACFWPDNGDEITADVIRTAAEVHRSLESRERHHVEYELLATSETNMRLYGAFFFEVKDCFDKKMMIAIGPEGVYMCSRDRKIESSYPFSRIHQVTDRDKVVFLHLYNDDGSSHPVGYRLVSRMAATSMYRCIIEMRCFYRCDSVSNEILDQTMPRPSLFSGIGHSSHGTEREYMFDIRHTCREVSDHARRRLHGFTNTASPPNSPFMRHPSLGRGTHSGGHSYSAKRSSINGSLASEEEVLEIRHQLEKFRDSTLCRICLDRTTNRVFYPCGHPVCCAECADKVDACPICRQPIEAKNPFFAPWAMDNFINSLHDTAEPHQGEEKIADNGRESSMMTEEVPPPTLSLEHNSTSHDKSDARRRKVVFSESSSFSESHLQPIISEDNELSSMVPLSSCSMPTMSEANSLHNVDTSSPLANEILSQPRLSMNATCGDPSSSVCFH